MGGSFDIDWLKSKVEELEYKNSVLQKQVNVNTPTYKPLYGSGAPTTIPLFIGQIYIDISTGNIYMAAGTDGSYNWGYVGAGALVDDYRVGLTSWYDASDSLTPKTNGSTLTAWDDKGSLLSHLVTVGGTPQYTANVQNGLSGAYFDGTEYIYGANKADSAAPQTHFLVFKPTGWGTGTEQRMLEMMNGVTILGKTANTATVYLYGGTALPGNELSNSTPYIVTAILNGASSSIQVNNNTMTSGNAGANGNTNYPMIGASYAGTLKYIGYVLEWRVYDGALTTENQNTVRNYLNTKWAVY